MDARLKTIVSNVLKLKEGEIRPEVSRDNCKAWTSLAHLLLITQIESALGIQLATQQVVAIRTVADLEKIVGTSTPMAVPKTFTPPQRKPRPAGVEPVALVTGSSRGIGAETARAFARRGFSVVVHYATQESAARQVEESLVKEGVNAIVVQADLSNPSDISKLFEAISKRWGRLDALVNNAAPPIFPAPLEKLLMEELSSQFNAHVSAPLAVSRTFLPLLKTAGNAAIVNVLSIFIYGGPPEGLGAYVAAKSALAGLTRSMAREWAKYNIRVNSISPGITRTALSRGMDPAVMEEYTRKTPVGRILEPSEVGEAIAHLACEPTEYATGAEVIFDGSLTIHG